MYWYLPVDTERFFRLQEAVGNPLGFTLAKHDSLRNAVITLGKALEKASLIKFHHKNQDDGDSTRQALGVKATDRVRLINAVLLQGVFGEPKKVIELFTDPVKRVNYAAWAKILLIDQQSIAGQGFSPGRLICFLEMLAGGADLKTEQLPNPFSQTLPQMGIGPMDSTSLLQLLTVQAAVLSQGDSMMAHYLNGDLEKAYQAALQVKADASALAQYRELIIRDYRDAKAVSALLDIWR